MKYYLINNYNDKWEGKNLSPKFFRNQNSELNENSIKIDNIHHLIMEGIPTIIEPHIG